MALFASDFTFLLKQHQKAFSILNGRVKKTNLLFYARFSIGIENFRALRASNGLKSTLHRNIIRAYYVRPSFDEHKKKKTETLKRCYVKSKIFGEKQNAGAMIHA